MICIPTEEFEAKALDIAITLWKLECARTPAYASVHSFVVYHRMSTARDMLKNAGFHPKEESDIAPEAPH